MLRDSTSRKPRFSHCFLSDPWIGGFASPLAEAELAHRPLTKSLRTMRVWLNEGSPSFKLFTTSAEKLVDKAKKVGATTADLICVPAQMDAQTDVPTVFESGPFACIYAVVKGAHHHQQQSAANALPAKAALRSAIIETLEPLLEQGWLAVGLAPLGP